MSSDYANFERMLIEDMRAHGGAITQGPMAGRTLGVLTSTGAKSGEARRAIVTWTRHGKGYVIAATKSGAPTHPAWYANLVEHPEATLEAEGAVHEVRARVAAGLERQQLWDEHAREHPEFRDYPSMTTRVIPVIVLDPTTQG
jgi:deazaflavin-dependent oxidoreductase (nitroreductase family)